MKSFVLLATILTVSQAVDWQNLIQEEWQSFKKTHDKVYKNEVEEQLRMKIYLENRFRIAQHNQQEKTFQLGMNKYGDMLTHEFVAKMNGYRPDLRNETLHLLETATFIVPENIKLPAEVDWRKNNLVTPVKDQGSCGSCWSFSSTGALEGQNARKTGKLVSLSEQNLVDCSDKYGNHGCNGGLMDNSFRYVKENDGIDTEESYPYKHKVKTCRYKSQNKGGGCKGIVDIRRGSEKDLQAALATVGPISIAIDASHHSFQLYHKGIYIEEKCSSTNLDHGVLLVGYGTENGQDYWLVKNSWGKSWGYEGYIKMARNRNNQCGVATMASYPLV